MLFVVHKHQAKRAGLHYDLRLEHGASLESYVLPKGFPTHKGEKRLAIKVEDHPLEVAGFEGVIEEGYGAGDMEIWDQGEFSVEAWRPDYKELDFLGDKLVGTYGLRHWEGPRWLMFKRFQG